MLVQEIALVPEVDDVPLEEIARIAAALEKQTVRDFAPIWQVSASVDAFADLDAVPLGYWPVILVGDVQGAAGVHLDRNGQPFALVEVGSSWSLTASHETLEMLADPFGNRLTAGKSPRVDQGRVEFLVEVCDPCEDPSFAYTVNDVLVSDFYTPRYFDPVQQPSSLYSFTGAVTAPRQVLRGGYLSWHEPVSDHWFQLTFFGNAPQFRDLGVLDRGRLSLREVIDSNTPQTQRLSHLADNTNVLVAANTNAAASQGASGARARMLRGRIQELVAAAQNERQGRQAQDGMDEDNE